MRGNFESLTEFAEEVERRERAKNDLLVGPGNIRFPDDEHMEINGEGVFDVNRVAETQIASEYGIPQRYYDRMASVPGLRAHNLNSWLDHMRETEPERRRVVRTLDRTARAYVSDRFKTQIYDNFNLMQGLLPVFQQFDDIRFASQSLTDTRMYLQVVFPSLQREVKVGDAVQFGLTITNSEVGMGSVDISRFIWRLICLNGAVGQSLMRKYHVGRRIEGEDRSIYADETIVADMESFRLRLRDVIRHELEETKIDMITKQLQGAAETPVKNVVETVKNVTSRWKFSETESDQILTNMVNEGSATKWALVNSITALSHDLESRDRQFEIEKIGNDVLVLSDADWEEVAA